MRRRGWGRGGAGRKGLGNTSNKVLCRAEAGMEDGGGVGHSSCKVLR